MPAPQTRDRPPPALLLVSLAVFLCTMVWFSGTAAAPLISGLWNLSAAQSTWLTIAVQLGFIVGTFLYAVTNVADIYSPRRVFFLSALAGAVFNGLLAATASGLGWALLFRFLTGVTLAGIYPVGMKLVASWFRSGLGWRLGVLIAALTMGKASAYLLQYLAQQSSWRTAVALASAGSLIGGALPLLLPPGPYLTERPRFDMAMIWKVFKSRPFRLTAFGYFGHMWELYAFWSLLIYYLQSRFAGTEWAGSIHLMTFAGIGIGAVGCLLGGRLSLYLGERRVALISLLISGSLCTLSGFFFDLNVFVLFVLLLIWGIFVISDSAQFSALATRYCPRNYTGTALTVQNGIGFAVTTFSLQLLPWIAGWIGWRWAFLGLAPGPLIGAWFIHQLQKEESSLSGDNR